MWECEISVTMVFMSEKKPRSAQSVSDMIRSLGAVGLLVGLLATFVWLTRTDSEQVLREVDWQGIAIGAQSRTDIPTLGPVGLDKSWVKLISTYVNIESEEETTKVIGNKTYTALENQENKAIYISEAGINTLIYSTANWDEITKFVESLKVPTK